MAHEPVPRGPYASLLKAPIGGADPGRMSDRRREARTRKRLFCQIEAGPQRSRGIVLNFAASSLFVQTRLVPGMREIRVHVEDPDGGEPMTLDCVVARRKAVPGRLASGATGGIGLEIVHAPERYLALCGESPTPSCEPQAPVSPRTFRVRVAHRRSPRSRVVEVEAASAEEAERRVLGSLGDDWSFSGIDDREA